MNALPADSESHRTKALTETQRGLLRELPDRLERLREQLATRVIGQKETIHNLLVSFVAGGHVLVIGVPGLAKTLLIRSLSDLLDLDYARIQFTPDLMPSDVTGTTILVKNDTTGEREFRFRPGPVFTNLLLADEINRTPPKTQASLLEAMEEYQVTVGGRPHPVSRPFFVLATQNPIEQEGTYPLPITQLDRFLFQINIHYPDVDTEFEVVATTTARAETPLEAVIRRDEIDDILALRDGITIPESIVERATRLVRATRPNEDQASATAKELLLWGAGPRAIQAVLAAARGHAILEGRDHVTEGDYEASVLPALRHRVLLSYHAEAEELGIDEVIRSIRREIGDLPPAPPPKPERRKSPVLRLLRSLADPSPAFKTRP